MKENSDHGDQSPLLRIVASDSTNAKTFALFQNQFKLLQNTGLVQKTSERYVIRSQIIRNISLPCQILHFFSHLCVLCLSMSNFIKITE